MRFATLIAVAGLVVLISSSISRAQTPGFNGGGAFAFDPEISVVNSGALLDAQVVVSADRKYVTINMRPSLSRLNALTVFEAQRVGTSPNGGGGGGGGAGGGGGGGAQFGFVGGAGYIEDDAVAVEPSTQPAKAQPSKSAAAAERATHAKKEAPIPASPVQSSPSQILKVDPTAANSVLRKEGMFRIESN
jgi:hypothetical protein